MASPSTRVVRSLIRLAAQSQSRLQRCWVPACTAWLASSGSNVTSISTSSCTPDSRSEVQSTFDPSAPDQLPAYSNSYYWVPHSVEPFKPVSVAQRRAAGRLESAIESVMLADASIREHLVERYGLTVHRIELARDRRTVFVLWDAHPGQAKACEQALEKYAFRLRHAVAKIMNSKYTPFLKFRHNHLPPLKAAVAATMEQVEAEAAAQAAEAAEAAAARTNPADAGTAGRPAAADVAAAIERLEAATQPTSERAAAETADKHP